MSAPNNSETIDITPNPRVLRMLGEIDFKAWQCLCEIIDNSIDSFSNCQLEKDGEKPSIKIKLPGQNQNQIKPSGFLVIEDNGSGMTYEDLNKSLKAGFSGNNPVDKMGLFGMGFNISTARLGDRTEIYTATKDSDEFLKVTIDFHELERVGKFHAPVERIPKKADEKNEHGTKIVITKLKVEHIRPLFQRKKITQKIGKIYGRIIRALDIEIKYQGQKCKPFKHCIWSKHRNGQNRDGTIPAIIEIDEIIDKKKYCSTCWAWMNAGEDECPSCNDKSALAFRERRVRGWIGIQRYFDANHYGIDLIRNGRVITELDKSFFYWINKEEEPELEYPIDGHQRLGRIVGELEIDFVKVTHQKDAFDKNTVDWRDVLLVVRGDGPIRPQVAKNQGYVINTSPLAKLFAAFRTAKAGVKNLVPQRSNGGALITDAHIDEMVKRFYLGETEYQDDHKWWELLNKATVPKSSQRDDNKPGNDDDLTGGDPFVTEEVESGISKDADSVNTKEHSLQEDRLTEPDSYLSKQYSIDLFKNVAIRVVAQIAKEGKHPNGLEVVLKGAELHFTYWPNSSVFNSSFLTPAEFLVNELAYHMHSISQNELSKTPISTVELAIREKYFPDLYPNVEELERQVKEFQSDLVEHLRSKVGEFEIDESQIDHTELSSIKRKMAQNENLGNSEISSAIQRGEFLSYASFSLLKYFVYYGPTLVFDGVFFRHKWEQSNEPDSADEMLHADLNSVLDDIAWFLENTTGRSQLWKARIKRLVGSLEMLTNWRA